MQWNRLYRTLRAKFGWAFSLVGIVKWIADWWGRGEVAREWMSHLPAYLQFVNEPWVVPLIIVVGFGVVLWAALDRGGSIGFDNARWLPEAYRSKRLPHEYIVGALIIVAVVVTAVWLHHNERRRGIEHSVSTNSNETPARLKLVMPPEGWLPQWGQEILPHGVRTVVDVSTMIQYKKPIALMLIYRIDDKSIEQQSDTRIVKSNIWHVAEEPSLTIDVQLPNDFIAMGVEQKLGESGESLVGKNAAVTVPMQVALVVLPKTAKAEDISKISDAVKLGGAILTINGFPFAVEATATKLRR